MRCLTIVGGVRERPLCPLRRRGRQYAPAALDRALLGSPSTSPLGCILQVRLISSMLKASMVATIAFAAAWVLIAHPQAPARTALGILVLVGVALVFLSLIVGAPIAYLVERLGLGRWWSYASIAALTGALFATACTFHGLAPFRRQWENPHAISLSPWTRDDPLSLNGILTQGDFFGSVAFCAIVGAVLGVAFWYFHGRGMHPNNRWSGRES
jgi:hypothetical protein